MEEIWNKKTASNEAFFFTLLAYLKSYLLYTLVVFYMLVSVVLNAMDIIDIGIPCLIKLVSGYECWGCGLTRAMVALVKLDFKGAWEWNKLIFIVVPAGAYFIVKDFNKFNRKRKEWNQ